MDKLKTRNEVMDDLNEAVKFFRGQGSSEAAGLVEAAIRSATYDYHMYLAMKHAPKARALSDKGGEHG